MVLRKLSVLIFKYLFSVRRLLRACSCADEGMGIPFVRVSVCLSVCSRKYCKSADYKLILTWYQYILRWTLHYREV